MEAALAEFRADELGQDAEEDVDFVVENGTNSSFPSTAMPLTHTIR